MGNEINIFENNSVCIVIIIFKHTKTNIEFLFYWIMKKNDIYLNNYIMLPIVWITIKMV